MNYSRYENPIVVHQSVFGAVFALVCIVGLCVGGFLIF